MVIVYAAIVFLRSALGFWLRQEAGRLRKGWECLAPGEDAPLTSMDHDLRSGAAQVSGNWEWRHCWRQTHVSVQEIHETSGKRLWCRRVQRRRKNSRNGLCTFFFISVSPDEQDRRTTQRHSGAQLRNAIMARTFRRGSGDTAPTIAETPSAASPLWSFARVRHTWRRSTFRSFHFTRRSALGTFQRPGVQDLNSGRRRWLSANRVRR